VLLGTDNEGREIVFDESGSRFSIGGIATSPDRILAYDRGGHVIWADDDMRAWVAQTDASWRQAEANTQRGAAHLRDVSAPTVQAKPSGLVQGYEPENILRFAGTLKGIARGVIIVLTVLGVIQGLVVGLLANATGAFPFGLALFPLLLGGLFYGAGYLITVALRLAGDLLMSLVQIEINTRRR
jgi:hypothetical protein